MARWEEFQKCPGCGYDFATGEGDLACDYCVCPYLPEELEVLCPWCCFNFFTLEGNSPCENPLECEHGEEPRSHLANLRTWLTSQAGS